MGLFAKFKEAWLKPMSFDSLNEGFYDDLEEALILADVGMDTAVDAVAQLKKRAYAKLLTHEEDVKNALRDILAEKLSVGDPALDLSTRPSVALIIGVNGVGKTTSIGKLAHRLKNEGKKVLLCAGDTFRAAAADQLEIWAERAGVDIVRQNEGADPGAVLFDSLAAAKARNAGKARAEEKARKAVFEKLREGLDVAPVTDRAKGKTDAARRAQLIDLVNKAVDGKADELLAGSKDGSIYDALLDEVKNGRAEDAQEELDRLMTAGKDKGSIKSKITESVKEEYLAGSDRDREKLEKKLLALEDAEGKPLYEEKNFAQWVSAADKKAEKAKDEKNWWEGVK